MGAPAQGQEGPCLVERSVLSTVKLSVILCPRSHNQSSGAAPASWIPSAPASHGQVLMRTGQALHPGRSPTLNLLLPSPVRFGTSRLGAGPLDPQRLRFFLEPIAGQLVLHVPWGRLHWPQTRLSPLQGQKGGGAGGLGPGQGTCQREVSGSGVPLGDSTGVDFPQPHRHHVHTQYFGGRRCASHSKSGSAAAAWCPC